MKMRKMVVLGVSMLAGLASIGQVAQADTYTQTKNPIVLVHGIFGFHNFLDQDYFYGVKSALEAGGATVVIPTVSAGNSNEVRGEQLIQALADYKAVHPGSYKFNIFGHSQGAPTARYVAVVRPDLVASVTSIGGVNKGSRVADIVRGVAPAGTVTESAAKSVGDGFATLMSFMTGSSELPQDTAAALDSLTTVGLAKFNAKFPAGVPSTSCGEGAYSVNGIKYYSWGGGQPMTNLLDPLDAGIGALSLAFSEANDGLVASCSQRLGKVLNVNYGMNHLDEINGWFGLTNWWEVSPVTVYRQHANRLKLAGM